MSTSRVPNVDKLSAFYQDALGFRLTDRSKLMAFLCCNSDHHAVVLAEAPRNGLNHIAFPHAEPRICRNARLGPHGGSRLSDRLGASGGHGPRRQCVRLFRSIPPAPSSNTPPKSCRSTTAMSRMVRAIGSGQRDARIEWGHRTTEVDACKSAQARCSLHRRSSAHERGRDRLRRADRRLRANRSRCRRPARRPSVIGPSFKSTGLTGAPRQAARDCARSRDLSAPSTIFRSP